MHEVNSNEFMGKQEESLEKELVIVIDLAVSTISWLQDVSENVTYIAKSIHTRPILRRLKR